MPSLSSVIKKTKKPYKSEVESSKIEIEPMDKSEEKEYKGMELPKAKEYKPMETGKELEIELMLQKAKKPKGPKEGDDAYDKDLGYYKFELEKEKKKSKYLDKVKSRKGM